MALPLIPILGAVAALGGLYLLSKSESAAPEGGGGSAAPGGGGAPSAPSAPGPNPMPAPLAAALAQLMATPNADPAQLEALADELEKYGFSLQASQLRAKAAQLRAQSAAQQAKLDLPPVVNPDFVPPPMPADIPSIPSIPSIPNVPIPVPTPTSSASAGVSTGSNVNVRTGPNESNAVVGQLALGEPVQILDWVATPTPKAPQGWLKISAKGGMLNGYASKEYIKDLSVPAPGPAPSPLPALGTTGVSTGSNVNVRATPNGAPVGQLAKGEKVTIMGPAVSPTSNAPQGWLPISAKGGMLNGFAAAQYISQSATSGVDHVMAGLSNPQSLVFGAIEILDDNP